MPNGGSAMDSLERRLSDKIKELQEEINFLKAIIKNEIIPEGYNLNDDATAELAVEISYLRNENRELKKKLGDNTCSTFHSRGK